ncbi:MAG: hypothetical protein WC444_04930 [Candidatus Paceibacterota bacterium]
MGYQWTKFGSRWIGKHGSFQECLILILYKTAIEAGHEPCVAQGSDGCWLGEFESVAAAKRALNTHLEALMKIEDIRLGRDGLA